MSAGNGHDRAPPPALSVVWFSELDKATQHEHLVKDLLLAGTLFVVYGESNSGKTFFLLDVALAIASGAIWRGRRTKAGLVVYIAGEGAGSVRNRVAAYRLANPDTPGGLPFAMIPYSVNFLSFEAVTALIETIRFAESECAEKVALVCVDTFARAVAGGDENLAKDVGAAIQAADRIRQETGACLGFIHHAGKDASKGARGSSALRAAVDTEILVEGTDGERIASVVKQRDLEGGLSMSFELVPIQIGIDEDDHTPIRSCVVRHGEAVARPIVKPVLTGKAQRQLLAAIEGAESATGVWTEAELRQIGRDAGLHRNSARDAVLGLRQLGYLVQTIGGSRLAQ